MPTLAGIVALAVAAVVAGSIGNDGGGGPAAAAGRATPTAVAASIRDRRYCEVLPTYRDGSTLRTEVWNTMGLNDCPQDAWAALDPAALATDLGALRVALNGPRFWLMDAIVPLGGTTAAGERASFGGIPMELRATLETPLGAPPAARPYAETTVLRETRYVFDAGKPIFTLTAPDGRVFVMQTYARMVDPALTIADLPDLGSRLTLPAGWRYRAHILAEPLALEAAGAATVIQDELLNTYQFATVPVPGLGA